MKHMKQLIKTVDFLTLFAYCAFIYWLSDQNSLTPPVDFGFMSQDKLYHAGAYFIMAVFAWRGFAHTLKSPASLMLLVIIFCSLYGASDEWHQSFMVNRASDVNDWLADTLGASLATFFLRKLQERHTTRSVAIRVSS
jgi:VanZ family protein